MANKPSAFAFIVYVSRDWHGGATCRDFAHRFTETQSSLNERSKGKEEERKGRGRERKRKGKGGREIGSEALAETEKIANAPAGNRTRDPSKRS